MGVVCVVWGMKGKEVGFLSPSPSPFFHLFFRSRYNLRAAFLPHPLPALSFAPFFARSLTLVPCSLLRNPTETLATQASDVSAACAEWTWFGYPVYRILMILNSLMAVKSVGTFPVILVKLATPPLPPQTKLNFEQNGWKWVLATALLGGGQHEPKADQKIVFRSKVLPNNYMEGLFHTVPSCFVLYCSY